MTLRSNDTDGCMSWLALGIEELGRDVSFEVKPEWMVSLQVELEMCKLIAVDRFRVT